MKLRLPDGTIVIAADFASFLSTYKSIFVDRIYDFISPTNTPLIVICGENIGLSVHFFKRLYPDSKVIAFEADPYIYSILKKNVKNSKVSNVTILNRAVWNKETTITFRSDHADGGRVEASNKKYTSTVKTVNFSHFLKQHPDITFLNMDIEGAEDTVLLSCLPQLVKIPFIFIEYHSFLNRKQSVGSILKFLEDKGFRIHLRPEFFSLSPFKSIRTRGDMDMQVNIFAHKNTGILGKSV